MVVNITGWGMFWAGLFGFLAIVELAEIAKTWIKARCLTKSVKLLSKIDPKLDSKLAKELFED